MLVSELRKEIEKYDPKELQNIIVELYKRVPKYVKEDYNVDEFIKNPKNKKKTDLKKVTFEELQKEIIYFLQCVDQEYYAIPNKIISKKERSGWRFKAKRYYKELNRILPSAPTGGIATEFLIEIFKRLSIGSNRLLFSNWETFRALGISQVEYYDILIKRILDDGYSKEKLKKCIDLLDVLKDPYELSYNMFWIFIENLKTQEMKETAISLLKEKVEEIKIKIDNIKNDSTFELEELMNDYILCITEIYCMLSSCAQGISYFHKHYVERSAEVKEYILLKKLEELDLKEEWLKEYEKHCNKISYRDSLKGTYKEFKRLKSVNNF